MKKNIYNQLFVLVILITAINMSCKKLVEVPPPVTLLVSDNVFTSDSTAVAAVRGIYTKMSLNGFSGGTGSPTFLCALSSDELTQYSSIADNSQFYHNSILSTNSFISSLWAADYNYIYAANAVLEGLNNPKSKVTTATKNELMGEAKFLRAFCHFYLLNLFGDVPLITSTDYSANTSISKTPKSQVYQQIILDLKDAQNLLVTDYSFSGKARIRANKWAATALLARVYLYYGNLTGDQTNYTNAETQATAIIENSGSEYSLLSDLNTVFLKNSNEAIWQLLPIGINSNTNDASLFILSTPPSSSSNGVALSNQLLNNFETGDQRKSNWTKGYTSGTNTWYFTYKYKLLSGVPTNEYSMVLRLAEQYLIRAEARAELGESNAVNDLNAIRNRAGLPNYSGVIDKPSLLTAILHERQVELFTEWGHRWLDLKRTGNANTVMNIVTPLKGGTWNNNWALYPIPQTQLLNDPNMSNSQNPGY